MRAIREPNTGSGLSHLGARGFEQLNGSIARRDAQADGVGSVSSGV
jgi:hypothetical protein